MSGEPGRSGGRAQSAALILAALLIALADQASKAVVVQTIGVGERVSLLGRFVEIWNVRNEGAAFSMFQGVQLLLLVVTVLAVGMIIYFHRTLRDRPLWIHLVLGLVLGGAIGNLIDRLRLGYVTDFVSLGFGDLRFPTFNVADSSLTVGIVVLVGYLWWTDPQHRRVIA